MVDFQSSHVGSINDFGMVLFAPPALRESRHRDLARRLVAVRRRAVLVVLEGDTSTTAPPALPQPS
jgi:hypothetical protein